MTKQTGISSTAHTLLGILVTLLSVGLAGFAVWKALEVFGELDAAVAAPLGVGAVTVLGSVVTVVYSKRRERLQEIEFEQKEKKIPLYQGFMSDWFEILQQA